MGEVRLEQVAEAARLRHKVNNLRHVADLQARLAKSGDVSRGNMRQSGRLGLITLFAGSAMLAAAGAVTAYQEFEVFATGGLGAADRFAALEQRAYHDAPSLLAKRLVLDACVEAIGGLYGRMQTSAARTAVFQHCRNEADGIARDAPGYAYAYYVGALSAAGLGDTAGFNRRVLASQVTGANEQWVAELRANLVEDHLADVTPDVAKRHLADLRLLAGSARGVASISRRYVSQPDFRERITAIVETLSEAEQARFVAVVGHIARTSP